MGGCCGKSDERSRKPLASEMSVHSDYNTGKAKYTTKSEASNSSRSAAAHATSSQANRSYAKSQSSTRLTSIPKVKKTMKSLRAIESALEGHFLFANLPPSARTYCINCMTNRSMVSEEIVIKQGTIGREFFVLERGSVDVIVNNQKRVTLKAPCSFGEVALMHNGRRTATIMCCTECVLWVTTRDTFDKIFEAFPNNFPWMSTIKDVVVTFCPEEQQYAADLQTLLQKVDHLSGSIAPRLCERMKRNINDILEETNNFLTLLEAPGQPQLFAIAKNILKICRHLDKYGVLFSDFNKDCTSTWNGKTRIDTPRSPRDGIVEDDQSIDFYVSKPMQRVRKYRRLIQDVLDQLPEGHPEKFLPGDALKEIERILQNQDRSYIGHIQMKLGRDDLLTPQCHFVREGKLVKVNKKGGRKMRRYLFLLNDALVVASRTRVSHGREYTYKYKWHNTLHFTKTSPLKQDLFRLGNTHWAFWFTVSAPEKNVTLVAQTQEDMDDWITEISRCLSK